MCVCECVCVCVFVCVCVCVCVSVTNYSIVCGRESMAILEGKFPHMHSLPLDGTPLIDRQTIYKFLSQHLQVLFKLSVAVKL